MADTRSSLKRKNPIGALQAYAEAFGRNENAKLVLKINGPPEALRHTAKAFRIRNLEIIDGYLDEPSMSRLIGSASVLLSLHRAEGFGLPLIEAMAKGIPCIATNWSGNMDFMNAYNSVLVPSRQVPVDDLTVYSKQRHSAWAEPDVHAASEALKLLYEDCDLWNRLARNGIDTARRMRDSWQIPGERMQATAHPAEARCAATT